MLITLLIGHLSLVDVANRIRPLNAAFADSMLTARTETSPFPGQAFTKGQLLHVAVNGPRGPSVLVVGVTADATFITTSDTAAFHRFARAAGLRTDSDAARRDYVMSFLEATKDFAPRTQFVDALPRLREPSSTAAEKAAYRTVQTRLMRDVGPLRLEAHGALWRGHVYALRNWDLVRYDVELASGGTVKVAIEPVAVGLTGVDLEDAYAHGWMHEDLRQSQEPGPVTKVPPGISLSARVERAEGHLRIEYTVTNARPKNIYLLDTRIRSTDSQLREPAIDRDAADIWWQPQATAVILRGIPPLPTLRLVSARIIPLGTPLPPGNTIHRSFELAFPLVEQNPYYSIPKASELAKVPVTTLRLRVQFLDSSLDHFFAESAVGFPGLFRVGTKQTASQAELLQADLTVPDVELSKRTTEFLRGS